MGMRRVLLVTAVLFGTIGYWLHCPVPDGYTATSTLALRLIFGSIKLTDSLAYAAQTTGLGSFAVVKRSITSASLSLLGERPGRDPDVKHELQTVRPEYILRKYSGSYFSDRITESLIIDERVSRRHECTARKEETDLVFDGVPVRIYEPARRRSSDVLPGFVWYHGGGYVFGDLDMAADQTRHICKQSNTVVVSVNYRLAPEHVFPAQFEDCLASTKYFIRNAAKYGVDANRIALGGDSAGGNLAATVSLKLRDESFKPGNKLQILIYPHVQSLDYQLPSMIQNADGPILTRHSMAFYSSMYLYGNDEKTELFLDNDHVSSTMKKKGLPFIDVSKLPNKYLDGYVKPNVESGNETVWNELRGKLLSPYMGPLMAASLANLPPAYVFSAEHDPLRDENFLYVRRLQVSGVKVTHRHLDIGFHGLLNMGTLIPEANELLLDDLCKFVVENL